MTAYTTNYLARSIARTSSTELVKYFRKHNLRPLRTMKTAHGVFAQWPRAAFDMAKQFRAEVDQRQALRRELRAEGRPAPLAIRPLYDSVGARNPDAAPGLAVQAAPAPTTADDSDLAKVAKELGRLEATLTQILEVLTRPSAPSTIPAAAASPAPSLFWPAGQPRFVSVRPEPVKQ